jgi:hypothetical protein
MCEPLCKSCSNLAAQIALYKVGPEFRLPKTVRDDEWKNHPNNGSTGAVKNLHGDKRGHYPLPRRVHAWRNQRIPRRLPAVDRKRQQGSERQLISLRKPPRRLRLRACGRLVRVKGETRLQRFASSEELWKWIDAHQTELGVGRPYLDRDPPHVAPIDGKE